MKSDTRFIGPGVLVAAASLGVGAIVGAWMHYGNVSAPAWAPPVIVGALAATAAVLGWSWAKPAIVSMVALRDAVRASRSGLQEPESVLLDAGLSPEAAAWNTLVTQAAAAIRSDLERRDRTDVGETGGSSRPSKAKQTGRGDPGVVESLWMGVLVVGSSGKVELANPSAGVLLGKGGAEVVGQALESLITEDGVASAVMELAVEGGRRRWSETVSRDRAGVRSSLRISARGMGDGPNGRRALVLLEDVTRQVVADEARTKFVEHATHELRTPLTNVRLYVEELIDLESDGGSADASERGRAINVISQEVTRLERIVSDMLSASEIESGAMSLTMAELNAEHLIEELKQEFAVQAEGKGLTLAFELPPKFPLVRGDRDKLKLALHNLVGNAIKYTPSGGSVRIRVNSDGTMLTVAVSDTGVGISPEDAERIFDRFYRAKNEATSEIVGTGLGLTLAREVVRLHGGDVTVESQLGRGSTFTMTIPTRMQQEERAAA
ncbi:MAG: hypothetical protein EA378_05460 [Phycisphaerales bacterium]|nr:MAG: hypothetical protein EA378_05460 [Phycisphaerales bacterium]